MKRVTQKVRTGTAIHSGKGNRSKELSAVIVIATCPETPLSLQESLLPEDGNPPS